MENILRLIADNQALFDAVKALLLKRFDSIPYAEGADDILLGQITRARHVGRQEVEAAFKEIASHKSPPPPVEREPKHR